MPYREFAFEPIDAPQRRELGNGSVFPRARRSQVLIQNGTLAFETGVCSSASRSEKRRSTMVDVGPLQGYDGVCICSGLHVSVVIVRCLYQTQLARPFLQRVPDIQPWIYVPQKKPGNSPSEATARPYHVYRLSCSQPPPRRRNPSS